MKHEAVEPVYQIKDPDAIGIWCDVDKDTYDSYRDSLEKRALYIQPPKHEAVEPFGWYWANDNENGILLSSEVSAEDATASGLIPLYTQPPSTQAAVAAALRKAAEVCDIVAARYPTDVFPDDGTSIDAKSAKMARITANNVKAELLALPHDDSALREFGMRVAELAQKEAWMKPEQVSDRVLGEMK